jgi:LmbE family N-acetylglucosaminyl deacetylase
MPIEETTALIAGIAVIAGTMSGGLIGLATERWRADRETELRKAERQAARDDLQRTTFLDLQDTMVEWLSAMGGLEDVVDAAKAEMKPWAEARHWGPAAAEHSSRQRMLKLVERVRDDQLRSLIKEFVDAGVETIFGSESYEHFGTNYAAFLAAWRGGNEALGTHLRKLM